MQDDKKEGRCGPQVGVAIIGARPFRAIQAPRRRHPFFLVNADAMSTGDALDRQDRAESSIRECLNGDA